MLILAARESEPLLKGEGAIVYSTEKRNPLVLSQNAGGLAFFSLKKRRGGGGRFLLITRANGKFI
jgi:hypothetical protein